MFSIDDLLSKTKTLVRPNKYQVLIGEEVNILAHTVNLPPKTIQFNESNNYYTGRTIKTPYAVDYGELTMSFYMSNDNAGKVTEFEFFYNWLESFTDDNAVFWDNDKYHQVNFLDEYSKDIIVLLYGDDGEKVLSFKYTNCFPTSVNYSDLSYSAVDTLMEVTVTFAFDKIIPNDD